MSLASTWSRVSVWSGTELARTVTSSAEAVRDKQAGNDNLVELTGGSSSSGEGLTTSWTEVWGPEEGWTSSAQVSSSGVGTGGA